jgi:hypothetical protein
VRLSDILQAVSLLAVAITLALSVIQNYYSSVQTRQLARQSALAQSALVQASHQALVLGNSGVLANLMTRDQDLMAWFLASRGIPVGAPEANRRYMLMFLRMEVHEATYLAHLDGTLHADVWEGWRTVIELDTRTPEFRTVWQIVGNTYAARFAVFVNGILAVHQAARR